MSDHTIVVIWFIKIFSVYSGHLFLVSSLSVRSIMFLSFIVPIFAWNAHFVCLSFLKRSLVFPILLSSSISLHWSLRKVFLSLLAILWHSVFRWEYLSFSPLPFTSVLFSAICKASSDNHFAFLLSFSWNGFDHCLLHNARNLHPYFFRNCLPDLVPWIYLSHLLYNYKWFYLGHTWIVEVWILQ